MSPSTENILLTLISVRNSKCISSPRIRKINTVISSIFSPKQYFLNAIDVLGFRENTFFFVIPQVRVAVILGKTCRNIQLEISPCHSRRVAWGKQRTLLLSSCPLFTSPCILYYQIKKRQLWDRGFRRNSSLQAAWDTYIPGIYIYTVYMCSILALGGTPWLKSPALRPLPDTYLSYYTIPGVRQVGGGKKRRTRPSRR